MKAAILTAGCRLNQSESDSLRAMLSARGVVVVQDGDGADVCYVNTCAVTAAAERSSIQLIRRTVRLRPKPRVVVMGCMAERVPQLIKSIPGVDETWSNAVKSARIADFIPRPVRSRAFLKVQDGCDNRCAYCVVSSLRGRPWSMAPEEVERRCDRLASEGFREVTLTGLNLGRYENGGVDLAGLLEYLLSRVRLVDIRLGSLEPESLTNRLLNVMKDGRICPHLHVPLQSGDDAILRRMGRGYTVEQVSELLSGVVRFRPDFNVGADVIAGFPGEDDESFGRTLATLERLPLGYLHAFSFSARPGTRASTMKSSSGPDVTKRRVRKLRALSARLLRGYELRFAGSTRRAIVENSDSALTDNYLRVRLDGQGVPEPRSRVMVRIEIERGRLRGAVIQPVEPEPAPEGM